MERIGEVVAGYRITNRIAAEPYTTLFQVERDGEQAFLRVLLPERSKNERITKRFLDSAAALQKGKHEALVEILEHGRLPDGCAYVLHKRLAGKFLSEARELAKGAQVVSILHQLASALAVLHREGIAYLDLQPERIVLLTNKDELKAQLLDTEHTQVGEKQPLRNTLPNVAVSGLDDPVLFMAPEYFAAEGKLGTPADVYALGVLAYQLLCGKTPVAGGQTGEVIDAHGRIRPARLRSIEPSVSEALDELVDTMLAKDPSQRPKASFIEQELSRHQSTPGSAGSLQFGDYKVERLLGEGGMGQVYEAYSENQRRRAAIKVIRPEFCTDPSVCARFIEEVRAANTINHPGIISIFNHSRTSDGRLYTVMEYLDGGTLRDLIDKGPQPALRVVQLCLQIALALAAAHEKGVIHCDLKPENVGVLLDRTVPGGERTKILDFGVTRLLRDQEAPSGGTGVRSTGGTPAYSSKDPSEANGTSVSEDRVDVYALGLIMKELLQGTSSAEHLPAEPLCPTHLRRLIEDSLVPDRVRRPSMKDVVVILSQLAEDLAHLQRPIPTQPPPRSRLGWWLGLGGTGVAAAIAIAALTVRPDNGCQKPVDMDESMEMPSAEDMTMPPAPPGMVGFAGGSFVMGSAIHEEDPKREVNIRPFALDIDEVTNQQFAEFLNYLLGRGALPVDKGKMVKLEGKLLADLDPQFSGLVFNEKPPRFGSRPGAEQKPVVLVTYTAAETYCRERNKRLPRENEWELAARGSELQRTYPWGPTAPACEGVVFGRTRNPPEACAGLAQGPEVVGSVASGKRSDRSPEGIYDLGGNVAEWVGSSAVPKVEGSGVVLRVVRGGDWLRAAETCSVRSRIPVNGEQPQANIGFRCARNQ